jgi:hypothetical protein
LNVFAKSKSDYAVQKIDSDHVRELFEWSKEYFEHNIVYEPSLIVTLNKVREYIFNENKNPV